MDAETVEIELDLGDVERLLDVLQRKNVHSFQGLGITVVFNEPVAYEGIAPTAQAKMVEDDGHSTSNKRVGGFKQPPTGYKHPALWQHQNGKILKFDGSLE